MFVSFIALNTIQGHAGGICLAFALEQNVIWLFNLIKGHKERESREKRDSVIVYCGRLHRQAFCRQRMCSLYSVVYLNKPTTILQEEPHAIYAVTNASTHKYSNQRLFTNSFCSSEFLKKDCRLAQNWVLCHYCVCSIGSPPILFLVSYFLILFLITGLLKVPGWFGPCHTGAAPRSLHPDVEHLI